MSAVPTVEDFYELRAHFETAISAREEIVWMNGYPAYPEAVDALMEYLISSPWCNEDYDPSQTMDTLDGIDNASISEVRSVLTSLSRSERFSTGAWEYALGDGRLPSVVRRAEKLTKAQ